MFKNQIRIDTGELLISKRKAGRCVFWLLDSGRELPNKFIRDNDLEIQCIKCKQWKPASLYSGRLEKIYYCPSCNARGENNSFYGRKHSQESKAKMRASTDHNGKNNPFYGKRHSGVTKKKISNWMTGRYEGENNHFYGKTHTIETRKILSEKSRAYALANLDKMSANGIKSVQLSAKGRKTKPERLVEEKLIEMGFDFKYNKIIKEIGQFDFIINDNILLEVNGDYWHANPLFYGEGKRALNETQKYKMQRDIEKKEKVINLGYQIFYIWENDIKQENFGVLNEIQTYRN